MTEKEHYIEKAKTKIDEWNAEIDKFKAQVAGSDADVKIEFTKQLDEMRDQRDKAETWLKELRGSSDSALEDMKSGFDKAWDSISDAFDSAMSKFR
jgi:predicted  nucleic acid-binding Zn-ribbon protein